MVEHQEGGTVTTTFDSFDREALNHELADVQRLARGETPKSIPYPPDRPIPDWLSHLAQKTLAEIHAKLWAAAPAAVERMLRAAYGQYTSVTAEDQRDSGERLITLGLVTHEELDERPFAEVLNRVQRRMKSAGLIDA